MTLRKSVVRDQTVIAGIAVLLMAGFMGYLSWRISPWWVSPLAGAAVFVVAVVGLTSYVDRKRR